MNICIHSLVGIITMEINDKNNAIICAQDKGTGIPDIDLALAPGFSTVSKKVRALGFGAGKGLLNIKNFAEKYEIQSSLKSGTHLKVIINLGVKNENKRDNRKMQIKKSYFYC
ncbi:MAG: hypothetical protein KAH35_03970 [Candidatus Atribacteria bacterium]|nr:hypothetical protein [Candidatus Atribacteria bacterium]